MRGVISLRITDDQGIEHDHTIEAEAVVPASAMRGASTVDIHAALAGHIGSIVAEQVFHILEGKPCDDEEEATDALSTEPRLAPLPQPLRN